MMIRVIHRLFIYLPPPVHLWGEKFWLRNLFHYQPCMLCVYTVLQLNPGQTTRPREHCTLLHQRVGWFRQRWEQTELLRGVTTLLCSGASEVEPSPDQRQDSRVSVSAAGDSDSPVQTHLDLQSITPSHSPTSTQKTNRKDKPKNTYMHLYVPTFRWGLEICVWLFHSDFIDCCLMMFVSCDKCKSKGLGFDPEGVREASDVCMCSDRVKRVCWVYVWPDLYVQMLKLLWVSSHVTVWLLQLCVLVSTITQDEERRPLFSRHYCLLTWLQQGNDF